MPKFKQFVKDLPHALMDELFNVNKVRKGRVAPVLDFATGWGSVAVSAGSYLVGNTRLAADSIMMLPSLLIAQPSEDEHGINAKGILYNFALAGGMALASRVFGSPAYQDHDYYALVYGTEAIVYGAKGAAHLVESYLKYKHGPERRPQ